MIQGKEKEKLLNRLDRIEGQVRGVRKMTDEDRYCMDILAQTRSIAAAIKQVEMKILKAHLNSCVVNSFTTESEADQSEKIDEILAIFEKYGTGK